MLHVKAKTAAYELFVLAILDANYSEAESIELLMKSLDMLASLCHEIQCASDDKDYS